MVRVSSFGQQQQLVANALRNQQRVFEGQNQISTGKKTDEYRGIASQTQTLTATRGFKARLEGYQNTIGQVRGTLDANDVQLQGILDTARELRQNILLALSQNQAQGFTELLEESYSFIASSLNTNLGGRFIFAGSRTDLPPVSTLSVADLQALPSVADAFQNDQNPLIGRIADNVDLEFGQLANEIGTDLFQVIRDIADNGPFDGELTDAQRTFLQSQLAPLDAATDGIQSIQLSNGLAQNRVQTFSTQHQESIDFLETFISDVEDVDIAEAVSRLNNNQVALQASFQAISTLGQLSLLDFL